MNLLKQEMKSKSTAKIIASQNFAVIFVKHSQNVPSFTYKINLFGCLSFLLLIILIIIVRQTAKQVYFVRK